MISVVKPRPSSAPDTVKRVIGAALGRRVYDRNEAPLRRKSPKSDDGIRPPPSLPVDYNNGNHGASLVPPVIPRCATGIVVQTTAKMPVRNPSQGCAERTDYSKSVITPQQTDV